MACARWRPSPLLLALLLAGGCCGLGVRVNPSPFQLALDTPAPAQPTPTRASRHPDLCEGQPCLNGGVCLAPPSANGHGNAFEYTCSCSQGFAGRNCEVRTCQMSILSPRVWERSSDLAGLSAGPRTESGGVRRLKPGAGRSSVVFDLCSLINLRSLFPLVHLAACCGFFFLFFF